MSSADNQSDQGTQPGRDTVEKRIEENRKRAEGPNALRPKPKTTPLTGK
jgi:hypothetical protein